jgi:hypothetical protein
MTFGMAIEASVMSFKIARRGWNGKNMFVYYVPGGDYITQTEVAKEALGVTAHYNPYFAIKNVNGTISTWVPSINDVLTQDWYIVE